RTVQAARLYRRAGKGQKRTATRGRDGQICKMSRVLIVVATGESGEERPPSGQEEELSIRDRMSES
ncbi:MAG TPA: hypothetical protein VK500_04165, partial [Nitrospiraceae bacterium]|nr:hypothetical protein [Nitrospiraceae bacterium]